MTKKPIHKLYPLVALAAILSLALPACSAAATQAPATATSAPVAMPTLEATATQAQPAPTEAMPVDATGTSAPAPLSTAAMPETGGAVVYRIVPEESSITYEVGETFFDQNNRFNTAIGVTSEISGAITLDLSNPQNSTVSPITVDISQFRSDSSRRDNTIRDRFLESDRFPIATFTPTQIEGLPATYTPGDEVAFTISGDMTIREMTLPVTFDVTARLEGETLTGSTATTILMSEFGFGPIQMAGILGTEDEVKVTFNFVARP